MRKEIYQMLEMIIKSAGDHQAFVNIRSTPENPEQKIIEATDSKRAIQIHLTDFNQADGQFRIGKIGKDYALLPMSDGEKTKFPEVDRVIIKDKAVEFTRNVVTHTPNVVPSYITGWIGYYEARNIATGESLDDIHTIDLEALDVIKPWCKLSEHISIGIKSMKMPVRFTGESRFFADKFKITYVVMPYGK